MDQKKVNYHLLNKKKLNGADHLLNKKVKKTIQKKLNGADHLLNKKVKKKLNGANHLLNKKVKKKTI